jgi:6-pyruvoyltetrahydropterin/6-carboxytetrahydropterin synthase
VSVAKDDLSFASAHFITLAGHRCEGLHGHNYRARATVEGALDPETSWVIDFLLLKDVMTRLCAAIDHLVLLPGASARIAVTEDGERVRVTVDGGERYVFPRRDCAILPVANTTAEMLAQLLAERLHAELAAQGARRLTWIEVEVEEGIGQSATCRITV